MEVKNEHIGESNPGTARVGLVDRPGVQDSIFPVGAA